MRWVLFFALSISVYAQTNIVIYETNILVQTYAGTSAQGHQNGSREFSTFTGPNSLAIDSNGNVFISENGYIRKISTNGITSTLAQLSLAQITCDPFGNVWGINWGNGAVYKIYPTGDYVSPFGISTSGFWSGAWIAADSVGNIFIAETGKHIIKKFDTNNNLQVFVGITGVWGNQDGCSTNALLNNPKAITIDALDNIYVFSYSPQAIKKITPQGCVLTYCATTNSEDRYFDGEFGFATFSLTPLVSPQAMAVAMDGSVYMANGVTIRKVSLTSKITTVAGHYYLTYGYADGVGQEALFRGANGIAVTRSAEIFVADSGNNRIRRIVISNPPRISLGIFPVLTIDSIIGRMYRVESSLNLTNWTTSATITATTSPHLWIDQSQNVLNKFYRAVLLP